MGMKKLKTFDCSHNNLEFLSSKMFHPVLDQLQFVNLEDNEKINTLFDQKGGAGSLKQLLCLIDKKCDEPIDDFSPQFSQQFLLSIVELWESGRFSDFTCVLGIQRLHLRSHTK
jgi:hypothetical protein